MTDAVSQSHPPTKAHVVIPMPEEPQDQNPKPLPPGAPTIIGKCRSAVLVSKEDAFLEVVDVVIGGERPISRGRAVKPDEVQLILAEVSPIGDNTVRIYCTHNIPD